MIILISPPQQVNQELAIVNELFEQGLDLFHIRKYGLPDSEIVNYVNQIAQEHRSKLVLHSHQHLAKKLRIERIHFNEADRKANLHLNVEPGFTLSTSVHHIDDFNKLDISWSYAFISPLYQSISKPEKRKNEELFDQLTVRTNHMVQLVALGGIALENIENTWSQPIDAVGLLGTIWLSDDPINSFITCKTLVDHLKEFKINESL